MICVRDIIVNEVWQPKAISKGKEVAYDIWRFSFAGLFTNYLERLASL